ncbi:23S rRNA Gm-2251 2'-O-methyltransferase [Plasticicumulans lactativorans]|uniref:23S rRNA (guanosine-2'-O-)-methyltransferase RlmB n=1 Tax=Plasticicumulans lactativorans TaxID=1133106 RepID=A0A4R2L341_9GAMM|nr:23S rRNA (guanosine(2251)-2'-O)-methyltransferase RlmB [Plasticicumulans lactativorans]TCO76978.1 23S rRNA Gm-2251 2'-O-methyltransferase [Plasticicumulans lactativorans]
MTAVDTVIYGLHAVSAVLRHEPERIESLWVDRKRHDQRLREVLELAAARGLAVQPAGATELDRLANGARHQGVVARCHAAAARACDEDALFALLDGLAVPPLLLVLDGVQDPHNLGACLRSAEAAGVHAVIAPKDAAAGLTPTVRKVACGAAERVPFVQVTNLARTLREFKARGLWLVGAAGEADACLFDLDLRGPLAIVLGAEEKGLRRLTREACDYLGRIPMSGGAESLNVSVATGVFLFEAVRQRR